MSADSQIPVIKQQTAKKRGSRKLLSLLYLFFIIIFAVLFFKSSFSKFSSIDISGNEFVPKETIEQAAKVKPGDQFFGISAKTVENRIKALPTVESVSVSKSFPGKLSIKVKEFPKAAYQIGDNGQPEVIFADGSTYPLKNKSFPSDRPILTGWKADDPWKKELCRTLAGIPDSLLSDVSEILPNPSEAYEDKLKMYTRSQFEVITRISLLADKIQYLSLFIHEFMDKNNTTGVLTLLDTDRGIPYDSAKTSGGAQ